MPRSEFIVATPGLHGTIALPGDKSISHRFAMLSSLAEGTTRIANFAASHDCHSTLKCFQALGVPIRIDGDVVTIEGRGLHGLTPTVGVLDAENSGTTMRLMAGILAGQPFETRIDGDASLRRRPMRRVMAPLREMGATIEATDGEFPPLSIRGGKLTPIVYRLPVASAQVKSCILLAGLYAAGETTVIEPVATRDHTERMLIGYGVPLRIEDDRITIVGGSTLHGPGECTVPSDFSSAAFLLAAGTMVNEADITLTGVGINQTRIGFVKFIEQCGAEVAFDNVRLEGGEYVADLRLARSGPLDGHPLDVRGDIIPNVIDELPMLAVLGACTHGVEIRDAGELRVKESDRIRLVVDNLRAMGAEVEEFDDGLRARGGQRLRGARIETAGDHRIAMAFSIAALVADGTTEITDADCAGVSFPGFYRTLAVLSGGPHAN